MDIWLTGCTAGLGRALVSEFSADGHRVVGCGRNQAAISELAAIHPQHHFASVDVSVEAEVQTFVAAGLERIGAPDLLINNAGIINGPARVWEVDAQEFDRVMAINVGGVANVIRHVVPAMIADGSGVIVNMSSAWGRSTSPEVGPYCASKWAIEGLTSALAQELPAGIGAVAVNPGVIATDMLRTCWPDTADQFSTPTDWARTAAPFFLSLSASDNGRSLSVA